MYKLLKEAKNTIRDLTDEAQGLRPRRGARTKGPGQKVLNEARRRAGVEKEQGLPSMILSLLGTLFGMLFSMIFSVLCCRRRTPPVVDAGSEHVQDLVGNKTTVDCERRTRKKGEMEALATPPMKLDVLLADDYEPGKPIFVQGPHGPLETQPPPDAKPGAKLSFKLAPMPDFQVVVPKGGRPGSEVKFKKADGVEISVAVPKGLKPGDTFNITPPALMVQVPEGATTGTPVIFKDPGANDETEWCRARVPEGLRPGMYFAVRLPPPVNVKPVSAPSKGKTPGRSGA